MELSTIRKDIPGAEVVVFIHGLLGSCRNLFRLYETVHKAGFSVLAYDQRGHGHSPHGEVETYTVPQLAQDAIDLLRQQGIERAHFVGHSLGGRVSMLVAAQAPDIVRSLTMLDVGTTVSPRAVENLREIIEPMPPTFASREEAEEFLDRYKDPSLRQFIKSNLRDRHGLLAWIFDLKGIKTNLLDALEENYTDDFKKVQCPVHIVRGALSAHLTDMELKTMLSINENATATTISKAGHWVHVDNFEDTASAVLKFLESVRDK